MSGYDRITFCDVVECCKECPRYGHNCDGDKRAETPTLNEKHQLSAETPTDLISRADAIEAVCGKCSAETRAECASSGYFCCDRRELEALPSAEAVSREDYHNLLTASEDIDRALREYQAKEEQLSAEAVQGEWVRKYDDKINCYWYECDQCGSRPPRNEFATQEWLSNFCPNCGARMYKGGAE